MDDQKYIKKLEFLADMQDRAIQALKLALDAMERAKAERGIQEQIKWSPANLWNQNNPGNWGGIPGTGPSSDPYLPAPSIFYSNGLITPLKEYSSGGGMLTGKTATLPDAEPGAFYENDSTGMLKKVQ